MKIKYLNWRYQLEIHLLINLDKENKITDCKYLDNERAKDLVVF